MTWWNYSQCSTQSSGRVMRARFGIVEGCVVCDLICNRISLINENKGKDAIACVT